MFAFFSGGLCKPVSSSQKVLLVVRFITVTEKRLEHSQTWIGPALTFSSFFFIFEIKIIFFPFKCCS